MRPPNYPITFLRELHCKVEENRKFFPSVCVDNSLPIVTPHPFPPLLQDTSEGASTGGRSVICWEVILQKALNGCPLMCCPTHLVLLPIKTFSWKKKPPNIYIYKSYFPFSSFTKLWFEDIYVFCFFFFLFSDILKTEWQENEPGNSAPRCGSDLSLNRVHSKRQTLTSWKGENSEFKGCLIWGVTVLHPNDSFSISKCLGIALYAYILTYIYRYEGCFH